MAVIRILLSRHQCIIVDNTKTHIHQITPFSVQDVLTLIEKYTVVQSLCFFLEPPWAITHFQQTQSLSHQEIFYFVQNFAKANQIPNYLDHLGIAFVQIERRSKGFLFSGLSSCARNLCLKLQSQGYQYVWRPAMLAFTIYLLPFPKNILIFRGNEQVIGISKIKKHLIKLWVSPFSKEEGLQWSQDIYPFAENATVLQINQENASEILTAKLPRKYHFQSLRRYTQIRKRDWTKIILPLFLLIGFYIWGWSFNIQIEKNLQEIQRLESIMAKDQKELDRLQNLMIQQKKLSEITKIYSSLKYESSAISQNIQESLQLLPAQVWLKRLTYYKNIIQLHLRTLSSKAIPQTLESFNSSILFENISLKSQEPDGQMQHFMIEGVFPELTQPEK